MLLDHGQSLQAREAGHVLVEDDEVEGRGQGHLEGVAPVVGRDHVVSLVLQEQEMRLEKVNLVVGPEYVLLRAHF